MKEQVTPNNKPLNAKSGVNQPAHSTLSTPKQEPNGTYWNKDSGTTSKII